VQPRVARARSTGSRLSTSTQTRMQRSLTTAKRIQTRLRKADTERKVRVMTMIRGRMRRPLGGRRPKSQMEYVRTPSEGNSVSYFTRKGLRIRGFKKRMMKAGPVQLYKSEIVQNLAWNYGTQGTATLIHNTNLELDTLTETVTTSNTPKMLILGTKIHYLISSGSSAGIKMRIYEGCYKRDMAVAFDPVTLWTNGMLDVNISTNSETPAAIDSKPFSSPSFNEMCHITKVTNIFLPMGRTHEHYVNYGYNKLYSKELYNASSAGFLAKWTRFTMFVCYGEPVADTDADISTASGRVLIVGTKVQRFKYNNPEVYRSSFVRSIPRTDMGAQRQLDEATGAVETVVNL